MGWFYDWQTLIAGGLGLAGGGIAYAGAIIAAHRQVAALQDQLEDARAARRQADERRRSVIEWAVKTEARRLETAVWALKPDGGGALPSGQQYASRSREQLVIESSALLRGEREDMSLLDDRTRTLLEEVAGVLDDYNSRIETAVDPPGKSPLIERATLDVFAGLAELVSELRVVPR
jgi:hypothetical protein